ncbi:MAG TPA: glycosyltransferase family 1 protein [Pseudolysinimonas sp.]|nr:glycosyltransferase family 1 protein [Pseudolysinimonas sp.]
MKIFVDCRYTRLEHHDGISRFGSRLTACLAPLAVAAGHTVTMLISDERQLALLPDLPWQLISGPTDVRELVVARQINALGPDVVFTPMQTMGAAGRRYALVKTVHDLIYYSNRTPPRDLNPVIRLIWRLYHLAWWPQRILLNQADEVVAISETTRALIETHALTRRPVSIVRNGVDQAPASPPARAMPETRDLLYMGSFMPYKNVETLARALHHLPGYRLHLLSRITEADRARLTALAPDGGLVIHNGVRDDEYEALLAQAFALVHASLNEGFGIPVIEAMVAGTPVVLSDIPIFREVGSGGATFFAAQDPQAAADAIRSLSEPELWSRMSEAGRKIATRYSWEASAAELLRVLESAASAPRAR